MTGELPPFKKENALVDKGIYVSFRQGDITDEMSKHLYKLASNGTLALVNAAFIQYLMSDFEKKEELAKQYKQDYLKLLEKEFLKNPRVCNQLAGLLVAWRFFCTFAYKMKAIDNTQSKELKKVVRQRLIDLAGEQKTISSLNPGNLLLKGLEQALKDGRAHILDSETGKQPKGVPSVRVGWKDMNPGGLCIGLLNVETGDLFIPGNIDVKKLINLLPEEDKKHFSATTKKFWIDLKALGLLECPEKDRNRVRKIFPWTEEKEHYHLKMKIVKSAAKN
ncbi:hypothetical protein [Methylobacter svalbardensis]|uniref:hypothetical protein n=1 Tax=Methylobacter svalbardensis TaxID=3080016 RepID=UPI0030EDD59E